MQQSKHLLFIFFVFMDNKQNITTKYATMTIIIKVKDAIIIIISSYNKK